MWAWSDWLELPRTDVRIEDQLGEGQFGVVYKGMVTIDDEWRPCAVKKLLGKLTFQRLIPASLSYGIKLTNSVASTPCNKAKADIDFVNLVAREGLNSVLSNLIAYLHPLNMSDAGAFSWSWILKNFNQVQKEKGEFVIVCPRAP